MQPGLVKTGASAGGVIAAAAPTAPTPVDFTDSDRDEISFICGIDFAQKVIPISYGGWHFDKPATYDAEHTGALKWGSHQTPDGGGTVRYYFAPAAKWTAGERHAFTACFALWSAEANISFTRTRHASSADVTIERGNDGKSNTTVHADSSATVGSFDLPQATDGVMHFTRGGGFGFFGDPGSGALFQRDAGYGADTIIHEMGHLIGLGHTGPYDASLKNDDPAKQQFGRLDSRLWSIMSYVQPDDESAFFFDDYPVTDTQWGTRHDAVDNTDYVVAPTTPMLLDILAIQRLYGAPTTGPLVGGNHVYGFNCNITGDVGLFFNFDINKDPVVTIWGTGSNNTLDLSGWNTPSTISMVTGTFSSADGLTNNIFLACDLDRAVGGGGDDTIYGSNLDDVIDGGKGADRMVGGTGNDTYFVDSADDIVKEVASATLDNIKDTVEVTLARYTLSANVENLYYQGPSTSGFTGTGNDLDNTILGWNGDDVIDGLGGADTMIGKRGNDTYRVDNPGDVVIDSGGGADRINVALTSYTLGAGIEELNFVGPNNFSDFTGNGNELDNLIIGWSGNDTLYGSTGNDTLDGRSGNDVYNLFDVTNGAYDTVLENKNAGDDIVLVRDTHGDVREYTMTDNVERGAIIGHDASGFSLHGNSMNNLMFDDFGDNSLFGEDGNDTLNGGNGQDFLFGGAGNDTYQLIDRSSGGAYDLLSEDAGGGNKDRIEITTIHIDGAPDSYVMPSNVEIGVLLGSINFDLFGSIDNNTLIGNSGNNRLYGKSGDDKLIGGGGTDELHGGDGKDLFVFNAVLDIANADGITDFAIADDMIGLDKTVFTAAGQVGALAGSAFFAGTAAHDGDDRVIYDASTGRIYYDADGTGGQAQVLFATISQNLALTAASFSIVG